MSDKEVHERIIAILIQEEGLSVPITADHKICRDLGVCDGDLQDFMSAVWHSFEIPIIGEVNLQVAESEITVGEVAREVVRARASG